ncbi:DUF5916 domain-containing protein [Chryseolinea lacunae]|uniref:Carbohydrate binding family 9 domain-containing protein n=1 Tax=Chryseolinea lacunae TaxID=2801331 RepID=A0ABS1L197_9BACT|nr:DUF5916 domain-containing protein [Chryseolinea lacunae]MBL0745470.1 carbohydrate binding family 9 domain-containing protein [Chryseolinea lacunae]
MANRFREFLFSICVLIPGIDYAQNEPGKELHVRKAHGEIRLDGNLDEADWQTADIAKDFFLNYPLDSLPPTFQSEVKMTFNDHFLYFGITCFDDDKPDIVQSLRRDMDWDLNDNIGIYFDPFNDFTNGFYFNVTPMGVQAEGVLANGASNDNSFNNNWDNKWYSHVERLGDRWVAEIAIPFKSIRYNLTQWNMTFLRNDVKRNQVSSWIATPIQYIPASFAYSGKILWDDPLPHHKSNISFIPYVAGSSTKDEENSTPSETSVNAGFDAKIGLTPSLNLDLTVNPDFSNVEVDRQVINLTRFEFGFPERRQFFLENSDLFAQSGFFDSRPFFSRRIGLVTDSADNLQKVPILYGARVSGKLGKNWRIGIMNMQTRKREALGLPDQNYSVAVVQRQIFSRSNIGFIFVNKQSLNLGTYDSTRYYHHSVIREVMREGKMRKELNSFNRVYGADFKLFTKSNKWGGKVYYHRSADAVTENKNYSFGAFINYNSRHVSFSVAQQNVGKNFNAEAGFVPSLDVYPGFYGTYADAGLRFYPGRGIAVMGPQADVSYTIIPGRTITDKSYGLAYEINFLNTSNLRVSVRNTFQMLPEDFNPIDPRGDSTLLKGQSFTWNEVGFFYQSNTRKVFNGSVQGSYGGFYNGTLFNLGTELNLRYQPFGSLGVKVDYNDIALPEAYGSAQFLLIGPRLDMTFTDKLFLTTFVQYNDRDDNANLNARFQWRFKPASDFFVVYTENYLPHPVESKNRALVVKMTYWLNL